MKVREEQTKVFSAFCCHSELHRTRYKQGCVWFSCAGCRYKRWMDQQYTDRFWIPFFIFSRKGKRNARFWIPFFLKGNTPCKFHFSFPGRSKYDEISWNCFSKKLIYYSWTKSARTEYTLLTTFCCKMMRAINEVMFPGSYTRHSVVVKAFVMVNKPGL